jgi:hypothetical protein
MSFAMTQSSLDPLMIFRQVPQWQMSQSMCSMICSRRFRFSQSAYKLGTGAPLHFSLLVAGNHLAALPDLRFGRQDCDHLHF